MSKTVLEIESMVYCLSEDIACEKLASSVIVTRLQNIYSELQRNHYETSCRVGREDALEARVKELEGKARNRGKLARKVMTQRREIKGYIAEIEKLKAKLVHALDHPGHAALQNVLDVNRSLKIELAQVQAAVVQWVTYDGTEATRPDRRCNEFNIGTVMFFTPLGGGTTMTAVMRPFSACRFPADIDPEDVPDDFEPDEWVWQRVDKPEVVWLAKIGDRWAYLPMPPEASE